MALRYLFGPVSAEFAVDNLAPQRERSECLVFGEQGDVDVLVRPQDTWQDVLDRLPAGWQPDFLALYPQYRVVPEALWSAPVPIVGVAGDWNLLWHHYRRVLKCCDLVLTDALGVEKLREAGINHARQAVLYGYPAWLMDRPWPEVPRDIDILFVGNFNPAVQRERLACLGRVAALADRYNVVIKAGVFKDDYRALLARSRIVFNRSIRGECNHRTFEAMASGALLFQETGNLEVPTLLQDSTKYTLVDLAGPEEEICVTIDHKLASVDYRPKDYIDVTLFPRARCDYVSYDESNLEEQLRFYLENEEERSSIAASARKKIERFSFSSLWDEQVRQIEKEWNGLRECSEKAKTPLSLSERVWQSYSGPLGLDPSLNDELLNSLEQQPGDASLHHARGVVLAHTPGQVVSAAYAFQQAWTKDPRHILAGLNLTEMLLQLGHRDFAIEQAERTLAMLDLHATCPSDYWDAPHVSGAVDDFQVEWEKAAWAHVGRPGQELAIKKLLVRWRLHLILAELSGDLVHYQEACALRPDLPASQAALGCALARQGKHSVAIAHLRLALAANPFDVQAARALSQSLGLAGQAGGQLALAKERRLLSRAAPSLVLTEPWFEEKELPTVPAADPAASYRIVWQGSQHAVHSLGHVNRHLCRALLARGHLLHTIRSPFREPGDAAELATSSFPWSGDEQPQVHIRHHWPPDFAPPEHGHLVLMQPWEFGSLPISWVKPLQEVVDEVWVPSVFVRNAFVQSGVPEDRVHVVPLGVDSELFGQLPEPYPLATQKKFKFLFVGGSIHRKGIDLLLKAYTQVFSAQDDVCLVVKDMGVGTFYQNQTFGEEIARIQADPQAAEILYLSEELSEQEMVGLYRACDCLVHPFRGEGFGLPILEAMAAGLPVIVTGFGPVLDYATPDTAYLLPARAVTFPEKRVDVDATVDYPFLAEPNQDALRYYLRLVVESPEHAKAKGQAARECVLSRYTWEQAAASAGTRLHALLQKPILRNSQPVLHYRPMTRKARVSLCMIVKNEEHNLPACLASVAGLVDEIVIVDTGSIDHTKQIAQDAGAIVADFPWIDSFAAARNEALRHATGDWIFWMDADDRVDAANQEKLRRLFASLPDANVGFVMKCLCLPDPHAQVETQVETVVDHVRLFRNHPHIRWKYRIHEQILGGIRATGGTVQWSDVVIHHVGYQDAKVRAGKLQRDLRLLTLEDQENPHDPFTLFNLGSVYQEQGKIAEALAALKRSLELSLPTDSIVRKLYALIAQCQRHLGRADEALATCEQGRRLYPHDGEILFQESLAREALNDLPGAIACLQTVLSVREDNHFASVDTGLRGHKARHNLAVLLKKAGDLQAAEMQWREVVAERPDFLPGQLGLAEIYLNARRGPELQQLIENLRRQPQGAFEAELLHGRAFLAHGQHGQARQVFEQMIRAYPKSLPPRVLLSHALLQEGNDKAAAENALRAVLDLDPDNREARANLDVLRRS